MRGLFGGGDLFEGTYSKMGACLRELIRRWRLVRGTLFGGRLIRRWGLIRGFTVLLIFTAYFTSVVEHQLSILHNDFE